MNIPRVDVLVINWNGREHLDACFSSLLAGDYPNARFILVDNASEDDSVALVRDRFGHDPRVEVLVSPRNLGWSGGNNFAMKRSLESGADYLFLLNNDTAVAPGAIGHLLRMAEAHPERGALAPKMLLFDTPEILNSVGLECSMAAAAWDKGIGRADAPKWNRSEPVIGVCGGAFFIRAEVLHQTGLLPEDFEIYLDDLDLCLRIWMAGHEIWSCPEAVVRHKFSATFGQGARARRKYYLNTRNRFRIFLRNFPMRHLMAIKTAILKAEARALGRAILDREYWRLGAHLRAYLATAWYWPRAFWHRIGLWRAGQHPSAFWPLVRKDIAFCPGFLMPDRGWYEIRNVAGHRLRSFAPHAWSEVEAGGLRLIHANCYPHLGRTDIQVFLNEAPIARLSTMDLAETVIQVSTGRLDFYAAFIFDADLTGEIADLGGWIGIEPIA